MKYYAVTNDPTELMHYGIKGMKWGVIRTDAQLGHPKKPRSAAYKKASNKLGSIVKSGIQKAETKWHTYNSPENKQIRAEKRYDRQTEHALQQARKGKLKYKKLDDWQVQRITERLAMERNARQLSNGEKGFLRKLRESASEGLVSGFGQGIGRRVSEAVARGSTLKTDRLRMEQQDAFDRIRENRRIDNARREAAAKDRRELKAQKRKDAYEHERDKQYEQEKLQEAYDYGAKYDKDGKLDFTDTEMLENYHRNKNLYGESRTESYHRQESEATKHLRQDRRNTAKRQKQEARQAKAEENRRKKEYAATVRRLEAAQEDFERQQDERERAQQAKRRSEWASEIDAQNRRAEEEQGWALRQARIREAQERDAYRKRLSDYSSGVSSGTMRPYGYEPEEMFGYNTYNRRYRARRGRR